MKRRAWVLTAWSCACTALATLFPFSATAVEFRTAGGTRAGYRVASQPNDDEFRETMPSDVSPSDTEPDPQPEADDAEPEPAIPRPSSASMNSPGASYLQSPQWATEAMPSGSGFCDEAAVCHRGGYLGNGGWASFEYLLWWRSARNLPPLISTSPTAVDQAVDGRLGQANTQILLGDSQFRDHLQPGGRFDVGLWLDPAQSVGAGVRFTALANDRFNYTTTSGTNSVLAVPFFNLDPAVNAEDTLLVADPLDGTTGSINVRGRNELYMGDVYLRFAGAQAANYRVDMLGGYFVSHINEDLILQTNTSSAGTAISVRDRFRTRNDYQGLSLGLQSEVDRRAWRVNVLAKVALTNVHQTSVIDGVTTVAGTPQAPLSGLFAQPSNSGTRSTDQFAVVPELGLNWTHRVAYGAELTAGYSLIYWSNTARAGEQINRRIDPTQTAALPAGRISSGDYFVQGLNLGLNWQY